MAGDSGGDGGSAAREEKERVRRQQAIDQLNAFFGVKPSATTITEPVPGAGVRSNINAAPVPGTMPQRILDPRVTPPPQPAAGGVRGQTRTVANPLVATAEGNRKAREDLYADTSENVLELNLAKLGEFAQEAERQRRFGLARKGQLGGSVDVDSTAAFGRRYDDQAREASTLADRAALDFRTADEDARLALIRDITAGGDANTAIQSAQNRLRLNADTARAGATSNIINNTFGDLATQYAYGQDLEGRRLAAANYRNRTVTPGNASYSGSKS